MVFFGRFVIGLSGVYFAGKRTEVDFSLIHLDSRLPLSLSSVPLQTFVFRASSGFSLGSIAEILRYSCGAQVRFTVVEFVSINVIANLVFRNIDNLTMHPDFLSLSVNPGTIPASGVRTGRAPGKMPFIL